MEFNLTNKIDVQAEKSILNEAILGSIPKQDMIGPSVPKISSEVSPSEFLGNTVKLENFALESSPTKFNIPDSTEFSKDNMATIATEQSKNFFETGNITSSNVSGNPTSFNLGDMMLPPPVTGIPNEFRPIAPTEDPFEKYDKQRKNLEKLVNTQVMPNMQKIANEVNSLSINNKNQKAITEERPTIRPENLIFFDRSQKASSPPAWA